MSSETILPTTDSGNTSLTGSTHCVDTVSSRSTEGSYCEDTSAEDKSQDGENCIENGLDIKICQEKLNGRKKNQCCGNLSQCVWGVLFVLLSVTGFVFTPLDFMLWEKLNMRPGLPPYEWWADPPDEVMLRAYVFNITNHERFLNGLDQKINVQEIGPIVYLEKLIHSNIKFNDNSTMTYTAQRIPIYLPEKNNIDLNATIIVPNMAVLGLVSYLHDANFLVRAAFHLLVKTNQSPLFVRKTIYEYLWDLRDPVLDTSKNLAPGLVPVSNMGILARIYSDFTDEMTVKIGSRWSHKEFFEIDRFRGNPQLPGYDPQTCQDRIFGSTEGVMYRQRLTKEDVLLYWRKTVCKLMPLYFDSELKMHNVPVYRYNLSESVYERMTNGTDCYDTVPSLPQGISDASRCYFDFPMVVSYPHFYTGGVPKDQFVTGLQPDRAKHNSYAIVEPLTGIPFHSVARMQSNLRIHDLSSYPTEYRKFSNLIIPLFWGEYNQESLPPKIRWTIYLLVVVLPPFTKIFLAVTMLLGFYILTKQIYRIRLKKDALKNILLFKSTKVNNLAKNKIFLYEKETFIKRPTS